MLKTYLDSVVWLVSQPDHARVAGYLAAHWGGAGAFARPGYYADSADPERLRQEVVQAIAEHDNGWWEWEAAPPIDSADQFPLHLLDVGRDGPDGGLHRWELGVGRFAADHPYVALLISLHAHGLYSPGLGDTAASETSLRHPLFGGPEVARGFVSHAELTREFLATQLQVQAELTRRLQGDCFWSAAIEPVHLRPHLRLLQVLDAMSLLLSFGGQHPEQLPDVPRRDWEDQVAMLWKPLGDRRIVCDPYPFDQDPLEVFLTVRFAPAAGQVEKSLPLTRMHALPARPVRFELLSDEG
jgi:hypothetical protein